jgi:glycosyltransferase involved in cell wall biosynthesis
VKRILINSRFLTRPITGVERYAREMVKALHDVGAAQYDFILAVPQKLTFDSRADIELFQDHSDLPGHFWEQIRLPIIMNKTKADLLWSPCTSGPLLVKKQVVTIHDASVFACPESFRRTYRTYYKVLLRLLSGHVLRVITDSEFSKSELIAHNVCARRQISVVHCGINIQAFRNHDRKLQLDCDQYVLSIGSRDPRKNVSRLLKAWQLVPPELKGGMKLVIAGGSGPGFAKEVLGNLPNDITFLGYVPEDVLPSLYAGAAIFVYPSIYEGFGFPPLEAMACDTPAIVSNAASLSEVCGNAALYCDPFDVNDISEKVVHLLSDDSLQAQLRERGPERVKQFTWQKSATQIMRIFEQELN